MGDHSRLLKMVPSTDHIYDFLLVTRSLYCTFPRYLDILVENADFWTSPVFGALAGDDSDTITVTPKSLTSKK